MPGARRKDWKISEKSVSARRRLVFPFCLIVSGYGFHLEKVAWSIFGTLSWEKDAATRYSESAEQLRQRDFHQLVGKSCGRLKLRPRNLAIYGKTEWGADMRGHYNFLIGRQGTEKTTPEIMAATMQEFWSTQHGLCKIEPFDVNRLREGVQYQSKQEYDASGNPLWHPEFISPVLHALFRKNAESALILPPIPKQIHAGSFTA